MEFDKETGKLYDAIITELSPPDGKAVSSAHFEEKLGDEFDDIGGGISDLIRFGVLEFVNTSGSNMHVRVRLRAPVSVQSKQITLEDWGDDTVWLAYIVSGSNCRERRAQRVSENRKEAKKHLSNIALVETLTQVPEVDDVWCEKLQGLSKEYAVLRKEPIFSQADEPWP